MGVFASLAALAFGFGAAFAAFGPWLILPFAGIEIAAVGLAFLICGRHSGDLERIRVSPDGVIVERTCGERRAVHQFNPRWARVTLVRGVHSVRVLLAQSGREIELGTHLGSERRAQFAGAFEAALRAAARA